MLEEVANIWAVGLHSLFDTSEFTPLVPNLWDKKFSNVQHINDTKVKKADVLTGYLVLFWVILYLMYEKCLNVSAMVSVSTLLRCFIVFVNILINCVSFWLISKCADKG